MNGILYNKVEYILLRNGNIVRHYSCCVATFGPYIDDLFQTIEVFEALSVRTCAPAGDHGLEQSVTYLFYTRLAQRFKESYTFHF